MENKGFTLLELMVVVAIIGILAAIAIPQFSAYRLRAFDAAAMTTLRNAATAQEAYFLENDTYTVDETTLVDGGLVISKGVDLVIDNTVTGDSSYHMEASHESSGQVFELSGPGGSVKAK